MKEMWFAGHVFTLMIVRILLIQLNPTPSVKIRFNKGKFRPRVMYGIYFCIIQASVSIAIEECFDLCICAWL